MRPRARRSCCLSDSNWLGSCNFMAKGNDWAGAIGWNANRIGGIVRLMHMPAPDPADALLQTYTESGGINYLDAAAKLPSRAVIEGACADLMSLMFPGFHGEPLVLSSDLPDVTRSRLRSLHTRMKPEIAKCF